MSQRTKWTRSVTKDPDHPGEFILDLGKEVCDAAGWKTGDTIKWINNQDGTWTLKKVTLWQRILNRLGIKF